MHGIGDVKLTQFAREDFPITAVEMQPKPLDDKRSTSHLGHHGSAHAATALSFRLVFSLDRQCPTGDCLRLGSSYFCCAKFSVQFLCRQCIIANRDFYVRTFLSAARVASTWVEMKAEISDKLQAGQIVRVRTRHWLVEDVAGSPLGTWLRLSCVDDDAQSDALEVLWEPESLLWTSRTFKVCAMSLGADMWCR